MVAVGFCNITAVLVIVLAIVIGIIYNSIRMKKLEDGRDES